MIKPEQLEYITARLNKNENAERLKKAKQERKLGIW